MNRILTLLASLFLAGTSVLANDLEHPLFSATCDPDETHGFRYIIRSADREVTDRNWTDDEKFFGAPWSFEFNGNNFLVDGKVAIILPSTEDLLVGVTYDATGIASSLWAYIVNIPLGQIGAAQINGHTGPLSEGIKIRATNLVCRFSYR